MNHVLPQDVKATLKFVYTLAHVDILRNGRKHCGERGTRTPDQTLLGVNFTHTLSQKFNHNCKSLVDCLKDTLETEYSLPTIAFIGFLSKNLS